jgi:hypothetical protein
MHIVEEKQPKLYPEMATLPATIAQKNGGFGCIAC